MDTLPIEIVADIFNLILTPYDIHHNINAFNERQKATSNVVLVCKWWHEVALTTPELWSVIEVGFCAKPSVRVQRHLSRTKTTPLDVLIYDYSTRSHDPDVQLALSLLKDHGHRWRSVFLYTNVAPKCIHSFLPVELPSLSQSQILLSSFLPATSEMDVHRSSIRAPQLVDLITNCSFALNLFQAPPLKHCILSSTLTVQARWPSIPVEFAAFAFVERLELGSDFPWTQLEEGPAMMPRLRDLLFKKCKIGFILQFLGKLAAPHLETTHVQDIPPWDPEPSSIKCRSPRNWIFSGTPLPTVRHMLCSLGTVEQPVVRVELRVIEENMTDPQLESEIEWLRSNTRLSLTLRDTTDGDSPR